MVNLQDADAHCSAAPAKLTVQTEENIGRAIYIRRMAGKQLERHYRHYNTGRLQREANRLPTMRTENIYGLKRRFPRAQKWQRS